MRPGGRPCSRCPTPTAAQKLLAMHTPLRHPGALEVVAFA